MAKKCLYCDKPMLKQWITLAHLQALSPAPQVIQTRKPKQRTHMQTDTEYFIGNYGYNGNNFFCSLRHGYKYALYMVKNIGGKK